MSASPDWLSQLIGGAFIGLFSWFFKGLHEKTEDTKRELAAHQLDVAKNYVAKTDLSDIKDTLRRIEDKLDGKADKP